MLGTVNVDETTYMFSPKVLDRANVIDFRVRTDELTDDARKPSSVVPGDPDGVATFLAVAQDPAWHRLHPPPGQKEFADRLRDVHALLTPAGFEFGHRVYFEAQRFAAILAALGDGDPLHALDLQVLQKVLPRIHGSRRRVESTLLALSGYCQTLDPKAGATGSGAGDEFARLPLSYGRACTMLARARTDQFVTFAE